MICARVKHVLVRGSRLHTLDLPLFLLETYLRNRGTSLTLGRRVSLVTSKCLMCEGWTEYLMN